MKKENKGFTLAEMLIVVAIIGILIAILIPTFGTSLNNAKKRTDQANLRSAVAEALASSDNLTGGEANVKLTYGLQDGDIKEIQAIKSYSGYTVGSTGTFKITVDAGGGVTFSKAGS